MKRPTQADVARLAGVSRATVSYVINGLQDNQVSEETRQRVLKAVAELGYQPDAMAQSLRLGTTNTIGLLIPDMDNPHYWHIAKGVEGEAQQQDYDLLLISASLDPDRELHGVRALSRRRIDGLILILSFIDYANDDIRRLIRQKRPLVLVGGSSARDVDTVYLNEVQGASLAMAHLLELGHKQIGFVYGVAHNQMGARRLEAYHKAMQAAGLDPLVEHCGTTPEDGYQAAYSLLNRKPRPTALLVINDLLAIGVLRAIVDYGLSIPQDISVASFDDINLSLYVNPRLTTVGANASTLGQVAARTIFQRLQDPNLPHQSVELSGELIMRDSTGPVPTAPDRPQRRKMVGQ
ncbi:MAG: LacI family transcriptional regulator [Anaerolineae bacterium]|nr:LacI family transcriptional regulator [Anaerolineae bacterium]